MSTSAYLFLFVFFKNPEDKKYDYINFTYTLKEMF